MIAVVGDVLLDVDLQGVATRLSPDAPVPVVDVESRSARPGGAGLVAAFLAFDGQDVSLVTALADDDSAAELRERLAPITVVAGRLGGGTPVKTRIRAGSHAVVRVDENCGEAARPLVTDAMIASIGRADAVIVADYGRGLLADARLRNALEERARTAPVIWDPHPRGETPVVGCWMVTPNDAEAVRFAGSADGAASRLVDAWGARSVAVTRGARGAILATGDGIERHLAVTAVDSADPCGAGDRLAASVAEAFASGDDAPTALARGTADASAFLAAGGVGSLPWASLADPARDRATVSAIGLRAPDAFALAEAVRARGGRVVATGGCFDLLHAGHAKTLAAARELGDCLIVLLNSDASVTRLKGPDRPILREEDRVDLVEALGCVDGVAVFDDDTPHAILDRLRPDIWVKGGDYDAASLPEASLVASWGGRTVTVPFHPGRSTTRLASALAKVG